MDCSLPGSSVHGDSPSKTTGVGCHFLLQRIFPTQGLNSGLPHCRWILYHLSHQGNPVFSLLYFKYSVTLIALLNFSRLFFFNCLIIFFFSLFKLGPIVYFLLWISSPSLYLYWSSCCFKSPQFSSNFPVPATLNSKGQLYFLMRPFTFLFLRIIWNFYIME